MKQTLNFCDFQDAFVIMNRENNFSCEGKKALFDYLEEIEESTGEEIELDVIALCCEFTEYNSIEELQENYTEIKDIEDLNNNTVVIMIDEKSFIVQDF